MTIMMIATMVPASAFAVEEQKATQIGNYYEVDDGTGALDLDDDPKLESGGTEQSYEDGKVKVDKTISATEEENVFDVNLTVKTTEKIEKTAITADAAAVLVIDCSGSMEGERISSAKRAAQTFINNFVANNAERKVAIVKFSGSQFSDINGATTIQKWTDASGVKTEKDDSFCSAINGLQAEGGTNIEAGLILAKNLLTDDSVKDIANKNVILLTDGNPTFGVGSSEKNSTSKEFICHNGSKMTGNGSDTSCQTHEGAEAVANSIKDSGVSTYAVYLGNTEVKCKGCELRGTGAEWLANDCGFTAYSAADTSKLVNIFKTIVKIIEMKAKAWIVTDPMGSGIDFVKFNQEANPVNEFEYKNGKITWDIKSGSIPVNTETKDGITTYTYSLSYQIKLDTLAGSLVQDGDSKIWHSTFVEDKFYNTNEPTGLTYLIITKDDTGEEKYKDGTAYCNIPSVRGFAGNLSFKKTGSFGEALAGATFKLTTDDKADWIMTATSDENGTVSFEGIPSGHEYTLEETSAPDKYTKTDAKYTVTVSYGEVTVKDAAENIVEELTVKNESEKTSISVTKDWKDNGNQDGIRPDSVTVQLKAGIEEYGDAVELNANNQWSHTFTDLPKYKGGEEVVYSVAEVNVPKGYTSTPAVDEKTGDITITNSHTPAVKDVTVKKEWKDNNNQDGLRTEKIEVQLTADGKTVEGKTAELSEANNWTVTFDKLPVKANGENIAYNAVEVNVPEGYTSASAVDKETGDVTITNSHTPAVKDVTVKKEWKDNNNQDGLRTGKIKVQLTADGKTVEGKTAELSEANNWTVTFDKLPVKANGEAIAYSAVEVNVPEGYTPTYSVDEKTGEITITNSHTPATTSVSVTKAWVDGDNEDGVRPDSVTVQLKANGEPEGDVVTLNANNQWTYTWKDLAVKSAGKNIAYTVEETNVPAGYEPEVTGTAKDGFTITNTIKQDTVTIEGTKTWIDPEGTVHPEITINLLRNGEVYKSVKLANGETSYKFEGLDKYDSRGFKYAYKVVEEKVPGYQTTYDKNNVVNTIIQEEISVSGTKTWIDPEGTKHPEITINLLRDGEPYGDPITLKDGETTYRFDNLPKYDLTDGHIYEYTVDEVSVDGYTSNIDEYNITNTIKQDYVSVAGTKTWKDPEGTVHPAITINLLQDGTEIDEVVLQNGTTTYEFTNLEKYDLEDGHEYIYTVTEDSVEGYISDKDNNNFTNTIEPGQTTISGVKTWIAPQGTEFPTVKIVLLQNGNELDSVELTNGNTEYSFDVPVYDSEGQKYEYAIAEADVAGYTSVVDGYNVTNTIEQENIDIAGTKEWNAPEGTEVPDVTIDLLRDGEVVDSTVIKSGESEYSFTGLDKYDLSDGHVYDYNIQEEDTEGYSAEYDGYDIVNTINQNYVSVSGTKSWVAPEGTEFPDITINLLKNGEEVDEVVLQNGQTDFTFDGLEEYSYEEDGTVTVNEYTVTEDEVEGYTSSIDGYNITNEKNAEPVIPDDKPKTGDNFNIMLFAGAALAALLAALAIIFTRRRRNA